MHISLAGKNGDIQFDGAAVQIQKKRLFRGGAQQFPVHAIQAVNFKAGSKLTIGYIQFATGGQTAVHAPRQTDNAAWKAFVKEPNVVTFGGRSTSDFKALHDAVQSAMQSARAGAAAPSAAPAVEGVADELKKLAELRETGVPSPEEFESEKTRLLGR